MAEENSITHICHIFLIHHLLMESYFLWLLNTAAISTYVQVNMYVVVCWLRVLQLYTGVDSCVSVVLLLRHFILNLYFDFLIYIFSFVGHTHTGVYRSEGNLREVVLSFYPVGPGEWIQASRLCVSYLLKHLLYTLEDDLELIWECRCALPCLSVGSAGNQTQDFLHNRQVLCHLSCLVSSCTCFLSHFWPGWGGTSEPF